MSLVTSGPGRLKRNGALRHSVQPPARQTSYPYRDFGIVLLVLGFVAIIGGAALASVCGASFLGVCFSYPYAGAGALAVIIGVVLLVIGLVLLFVPGSTAQPATVGVYTQAWGPQPPTPPAAPMYGWQVGPTPVRQATAAPFPQSPSARPRTMVGPAPRSRTQSGGREVRPSGRSRKRWTLSRWLVLCGALLIGGIVLGSLLWYEYQPGGPLNPSTPIEVQVSEVVWEQDNSSVGTSPGFSVIGGSPVNVAFTLTCDSFLGFSDTCKTGSVYIHTPGFGLQSTNAPASWSSGPTSSTFTVYATLVAPLTAYSGTLALDLY